MDQVEGKVPGLEDKVEKLCHTWKEYFLKKW